MQSFAILRIANISSKIFSCPTVEKVAENTSVRAGTFRDGDPVGYGHSVDFIEVSGIEPKLQSADDLKKGLAFEYNETPFQEDELTFRKHWLLR